MNKELVEGGRSKSLRKHCLNWKTVWTVNRTVAVILTDLIDLYTDRFRYIAGWSGEGGLLIPIPTALQRYFVKG